MRDAEMLKRSRLVTSVVVVGLYLMAGSALAEQQTQAPFGLSWGASTSEVRALGVDLKPMPDDETGKRFIATSLPKVLADIEMVVLQFGYRDRLWRVAAVSKSYENDPYGSAILARYDELSGLLASKYGTGSQHHHRGDSLYSEPQYFIAGIRGGESWHYTDFSKDGTGVQLSIRAQRSDAAYYLLSYVNETLENEVTREQAAKESDAL